MMRMMGVLCLVMLMVLGLSSPTVALDQETSNAPYIYYYSDILNAFVIERADGTDSRTIGEGLIPEFTNTILGPGWSPSGEWLAWAATETYRGFTLPAHVAVVLNANGERFSYLDDYISAEMAWSPVDDVLVIGGIKGEFDPVFEADAISVSGPAVLTFEMIDMATETILASYEIPHEVHAGRAIQDIISINYVGEPTIAWSADGQQAIVRYLPERPVPETPYNQNIIILSRDGSVREVVEEIPALDYSVYPIGVATGIHAGKIAYDLDENRTTAVIEDLVTNERFEIVTDPGTAIRAYLSPVENTAILIVKPSDCTYPRCPTDIWLWEAEGDSMTLVIPDAPVDTAEWSPDGQYALFVPEETSPYLLSMNPYSINQLDEVEPLQAFAWIDSDTARFVEGVPRGAAVAHDFDLTTRTIIRTFPESLGTEADSFAGARWSPDGTELAFVADGLLILDEDFEPLVTFRPDGRSWFSDYGGDTYWHSDGEWLFVGDDAAVTGGNARLIGIAKNDGTVRRDLDTCYIGQCYGWLPATVDINQLPQGQSHSVVPEPSRVLHGSDWCLYLSWSPDGRQILCSTNRWQYEAGATLIFDVESGGVIGEMDGIVDYDEVVEWTLENVQYVPNDVDIQHQHWGEDEYSFIIGESPDGAYTIVRERHVNVYDSATKTLIFSTELFYNSPFVSFNTDGSIMALADNLVRVRLYDTTSWEHIITLKTNATALAFSPDGETLAVASSWDIQLWDVETLLSNTSE